jgi:hypothetical protein
MLWVLLAALAQAPGGEVAAAGQAPPKTVSEATVTAPAAAPAATQPDPDPVVCKMQVVSGSRLPVKVCSRASSDAARKRSGQDALTKFQTNNGMRGPGDYIPAAGQRR